ncbi:glycoside hydrolase family 78 protein [Microbacterium sp. LRZ72]|uniref:family 78 glycoside hydrolase catalytic domain n=1 Tax=Microbacterium sp. LRZ72 TaxID=2942481 RepID=UPI0029A7ABC3|nr:family 78 glycoside hydrolase catalytic domain [Microbacterium sp. LRZ72]MDX2377531.1 glycoside hydrolase family 78 protein [Microbacterium sp. LRZ72]
MTTSSPPLADPGYGPARISTLRAELRDDAPWVASPTPRLTWRVEDAPPGWLQAWADVRCGDDVVRLEGRDSVLVDWPFAPLDAGAVVHVDVRACSHEGTLTEWSEPLEVAAGFADRWIARPVGLHAADAPARPALLRTVFDVDRPVQRAVLYSSALGAADWNVNGTPADDAVLAPGWTSYQLRVVHDTIDVTALIGEGRNVLAARLAGAWFTEEYHVLTPPTRFYGDQPFLLGQLHVQFTDGTHAIVATDEDWRAIPDPGTTESGIYGGERHDARATVQGWTEPDFDASGWAAVRASTEQWPTPEARVSPPVRRIESVPVSEVLTSPAGSLILDFGQNLVGRLRIRVDGERGEKITLRHAEVLENGELALRPLRLAAATDEYVLSGGGVEEWEPRFTFHGFRYAQIEGWPGGTEAFDPTAVEAIVLHTDMRRTGWFSSSDERLNRFHENVVWTMRGNYLSIPQDCPQRDERLGWTGDTQLFAPTAAFLYDSQAFFVSWLRDLALEQRRAGGIVPLFAPDVIPDFADRGPTAAWGDAIAIIPDVLASSTGDTALLREFFPAMGAYVDVMLAARDDDALWTSGRQLADWLDPNAPPNAPGRGRTDTDIVATAYLVHTTRLVSRIARDLGEHTVAAHYETEAESSRRAYVDTYVTPSGRMMCDTQTAYALTIAFDLVPDPALRMRLGDRLAHVVRRDGYRIATGLVGTAVINRALSETGHAAAAERLLMQTEAPSWLYPVTVGATTIWERWDGLREDGSLNPGAMISFNHVALGSVAHWLHETVAGLAPAEPGYRRLRIRPLPLGRLDHARAEHDTPYGRAASGWARIDGHIRVDAVVPPNTTAEVHLPDGRKIDVGHGRYEWDCAEAAPPAGAAPVTLDSSMADLADDDSAHAAFFAALQAQPNAFLPRAVRANALYTPGRSIRDALVFADHATLEAVAGALAMAHANR